MQGSEKQEAKDKEIIAFQLGRRPLFPLMRVAKRCKKGFPQVIINFPTKDGKIWLPTIFWLTCPYLHYVLSKIENTGLIKVLENKILKSPFLRKKLLKDQKRCTEIKDIYFSFLKIYDPYGEKFFKRGVGGVFNPLKIKCLHLHYAFFLGSGRGVIGEIVDKILRKQEIDSRFCNKDYIKYCGRRFKD